MTTQRKILAINGSYREGGITDQAIDAIRQELQRRDVEVTRIDLRDHPIEFCLNCRECMQEPGEAPGRCVQDDGMREIVEKIEAADGYILAAPTNFSSVTALFKRFSERLAVYGYWPWGRTAPVFRKDSMKKKPAVLVSSSSAPSLLARPTFSTLRDLRIAARAMGSKPVGTMHTGMISDLRDKALPPRAVRRARSLAHKLA